MSYKIIFDTDPGVDDAMAIQFALNSPEIEILGLTTVYGNVDLLKTTANALRLLEIAERTDIPVAKGTDRPLTRSFNGGVPFVHGDDGQGNTNRQVSRTAIHQLSAHDFMAEQVRKFPNEITLVAVGPLTNLALFIQHHEALVSQVKEVIIMGGNAFCPGNVTPGGEANILNDPEAADRVFGAAWQVNMIGLDVTHKVMMSDQYLEEIATRSSELNKFVSEAVIFYRDFYHKNNKINGIFVHDSSAVAYLLNRELFKVKSYPIKVETTTSISLGKTWALTTNDVDFEERPELLPWKGRPKVNICVDVDADAVLSLLNERLR